MTDEEEIRCKFASDVLYKFVTSKESRLKYGAVKRLEMQKSLQAGKKVDGYRAEWILRAAENIIKVLIKDSERFNNTYYHDMISINDMRDVLTSTINRLDKIEKGKKQ